MSASISRLISAILNIARVLTVLRACQVIKDPVTIPNAPDDRDILGDLLHHSIDRQTLPFGTGMHPDTPDDEYLHSMNITASIAMYCAITPENQEAQGYIMQLPMFANSDDSVIDQWTANITANGALVTPASLEFSRIYHFLAHVIHYFAITDKYSALSRDDAIDRIITEYIPPIHRDDISQQSRELFTESLKQFAKSSRTDSLFQHIANAHHLLEIMNGDLHVCELIIEKMQGKIGYDWSETCA